MPKYIEKFLHQRNFSVKVEQYISSTHTQVNGVPQGSVLAVTLFALKINAIVNCVPRDSRFVASLYVDDFQLGYRHSDLRVIKDKLQQCLDNAGEWAKRNGFKFSLTKTKVVHFSTRPGLHNSPTLKQQELPYVDKIKFLGLIWDPKLTWKPHVNKLRSDCQKLVGLLRAVISQEWGGNQRSTLKIYQMFVRSQLDYGSPVYGSAAKTTLSLLDAVTSESLRIITGAFKTTQIHITCIGKRSETTA